MLFDLGVIAVSVALARFGIYLMNRYDKEQFSFGGGMFAFLVAFLCFLFSLALCMTALGDMLRVL